MFGFNNMIKKNVSYLLEIVDSNVAHIVLTDGEAERFSVPKSLVKRPGLN